MAGMSKVSPVDTSTRIWRFILDASATTWLAGICLIISAGSSAILWVVFRSPDRRRRFSQVYPLVSLAAVALFSKLRFLLRLRFSLRTLLVGILILGSALGWLGALFKRTHDQREAVRRIESLGGLVSYDYIADWLKTNSDGRNVRPSPPGNRLIRAIVGDDVYAHVAVVYFAKPISEADLMVVEELLDVTHVGIGDGAISSKGLVHLAALGSLRSLGLDGTTVTAADLCNSAIGARLEQLNIGGTTVVNATLTELAKLKNLETLQLVSAGITDDGLSSVASCAGLRSLDLFRCATISDKGVIQLGSLKNLRHLGVAEVPITNGT